MQLTPHFSFDELTRSEYAESHHIDNTPIEPVILDNLHTLAQGLERIRALVGKPIILSSGYRSPKVNAGVGGSKTSSHMKGLAADINVPGMTPRDLAKLITLNKDEVDFDQCILEFDRWVHVGFVDQDTVPRGQILTAAKVHGATQYLTGIV